MTLPEESPKPEDPGYSEETFPAEPVLPEGFMPIGTTGSLTRARRRRAQRMLVPPGASERATLLDDLAQRAFPSFEFFLFAFLCGVILGAAYLLNAPALLLLGLLLAPLLTPWVGLVLATVTGSWRFFILTLSGLLVADMLVFLTGALAGYAGRVWLPMPLENAYIHSHFWWEDFFIVALGAALLAISFVRSEKKPVLPSIMLAYGLFLPLSAAGVGLGIGAADFWPVGIWPVGVQVSFVYLALAMLVGGIVLVALRFKPVKISGYLLPVLIGLLSVAALITLTGLDTFIRDGINATRRIEPTPTILNLSVTATASRTWTPVPTHTPSTTPSITLTVQPTPAYAIITSPSGGGALVRTEAGGGSVLKTLNNGFTVEVLPEIKSVNGQVWVLIKIENVEGWVLQTVLTATIVTPTPNPSFTPTP
jgi:hypothetical protein